MRLLIFIIILIGLYYFVSKYLFPYLVKRFIRKTQERFSGFGQQPPQQDQKKEGEVSVKYVPPDAKKHKFDPDDSEDVDYEEIKE